MLSILSRSVLSVWARQGSYRTCHFRTDIISAKVPGEACKALHHTVAGGGTHQADASAAAALPPNGLTPYPIYIYMYIYIYIYIYVYMYICIYVYMHICICVSLYKQIYICIKVFVYICPTSWRGPSSRRVRRRRPSSQSSYSSS